MKTARTPSASRRLLARLSLVSRLAAPVACVGALAVASTVLVACQDENDPKTWVKRLDDPGQRGLAVKKLKDMWDARLVAANNDKNNADVKAFVDIVIDKLTAVYAAGGLDDILRKDLIKFVADLQDPRNGAALKKALDDFAPGKNDDDTLAACDSIDAMAKAGKQLDPTVYDSLWTVFSNYHLSKAQNARLTKSIHDAILDSKAASYGAKAVTMLGNKVDQDKDDTDKLMDELQFWQLTAVQLLRDMKFTGGVKTLVTVLLDKNKLNLNGTVKSALIAMAKDAETVLIAGINGTDPDLKKLGDTYTGAQKGYDKAILSDMLGYIGRPAGRDALIAALDGPDAGLNDGIRIAYAQALTMCPSNAQTQPHFLKAYDKISAQAVTPFNENMKGKTTLVQVAAQLYDPSLTDWLVAQMIGGADLTSKLAPLDTALRIAPLDRKQAISDALSKLEPDLKKLNTDAEKAGDKLIANGRDQIAWEMGGNDSTGKPPMIDGKPAQGAAEKCKTDPACYLAILDEPIPSAPEVAHWRWVKAAYMAVIYGGGAKADGTRAELMKRLDKVKDQLARLSIIQAIDELAPKGDEAAAKAMDDIVARDKLTGDKNLLMADDNVVKISQRLRARAM